MRRLIVTSRLGLLGAACIALPSLLACLDHPLKPVEYDQSQEETDNIALTVNKDVDILFVIDNSGSMGEEQATLSANFASFINVLEQENVKANYRIGITTTDNGNFWCSGGQGGALRLSSCRSRQQEFVFTGMPPVDATQAACLDVCNEDSIAIQPTTTDFDDNAVPRPWLESIEGKTNLPDADGDGTPDISTVEAFQCFGPQGINGCGFESHLESMYKALRRSQDENEASYGFLRSNAILSVVFVTDEADCSSKSEFDTIFRADGDKAFWTNPMDGSPTSAVCWNAGVACMGSSPFSDCQPENYDTTRNPGVADDAAVLWPVSRYTGFLQGFEDEKKQFQDNQEVLVAIIGGVPTDYEGGSVGITYQDTGDAVFQNDFGIGPGCESVNGKAVPPVRLRSFAEAFNVPQSDNPNSRNMYSVCADNYSAALDAIANAIADQVRPACMPACVADTDPTTSDVLDISCILTQTSPGVEGGIVEEEIPRCNPDGSQPAMDTNVCFRALTSPAGSGAADEMSQVCTDEGWNLEFVINRRPGFPAAGGTSVRATCQLSANKRLDCPGLP